MKNGLNDPKNREAHRDAAEDLINALPSDPGNTALIWLLENQTRKKIEKILNLSKDT